MDLGRVAGILQAAGIISGMTRFLVTLDYGMGALWWWIRAGSARQVVETFAETQVVDPGRMGEGYGSDLAEYDIDDVSADPVLPNLRARRDAQRDRAGFGALVGLDRVYLHRPADDECEWVCFQELDGDGRRLRQVEVRSPRVRLRTTEDDWWLNPPADLYDPELAACRIGEAEFEAEWAQARPPRDDES